MIIKNTSKLENKIIKEMPAMLDELNFVVKELKKDLAPEVPTSASDEDYNYIDIRLQVYSTGHWAFRVGPSDYDHDHRGFFGSGCVDSETKAKDLLDQMIEQVLEQVAEADDETLGEIRD